jgi:hypothetical protein
MDQGFLIYLKKVIDRNLVSGCNCALTKLVSIKIDYLNTVLVDYCCSH